MDGVQDCTRIGAVRLIDIHKYNQGITWGVDDLDRRRNIVMERCVIAGKSFGCVTTALIACRQSSGCALSYLVTSLSAAGKELWSRCG